MTNRRRKKASSADSIVAAMQAASVELFPPEHVPLVEKDIPFWINVIAEKAKVEWTAHELEIAAMLARTMRRVDEEEQILENEGMMLFSPAGTPMKNPRAAAINEMHGRIIRYRSSLAINNRGKNGGDNRRSDRRNNLLKEAENRVTDSDDDLLARPN